MKKWKVFCYISIFTIASLMMSCVRESEMGNGFKKPSKEDLNRAISLYVQIAYKALENNEYERAMANVKQALDIDKNSPMALNALAVVFQSQGDTGKARETFKKALSNDANFSDAHLNYGQFLLQQKESEAACKQFQLAADDDFYQKRAIAYFYMGVCHKNNGDIAQSESALERCLGLDPANAQAMGMLASIKFEKHQYPEAKELFDKHVQAVRASKQVLSAEALWLGIQLERVFNKPDAEASWALFLKNNYPYSKEYLEYQKSLKK